MVKIRIGSLALAALLLGSITSCEKSTDSTELVGNWLRKSDFEGVARSEGIATTIGSKVYIGLGYNGTSRLTDLWEYDATADSWEQMTSFPGTARNSAVSFAAGGKLYVGLGYDGNNYLKDFWEFDPNTGATGTWKQVADFGGSARYDAVAFGINDKGYVVGGYDDNYLKDFWEYSPTANTWTKKVSPGGTKRTQATAFVISNIAYLVTGTNNGANVNELWAYDPTTDAWTEKRKVTNVSDETYDDDYSSIIRNNAVSFVIDGKGYITSGNNGGYTSTTWEYNPVTDLWTQKTAFEGTTREGAIGFSANNRGYVGLGRSSSLRFDDLREFKPTLDYNAND